jgi:hypothetical protein
MWLGALELYENDAHKALEYKSWAAYWEAEMDQDGSRGHQILEAARVTRTLAQSTIVEWGKGDLPSNEGQARELVTLKERPEEMAAAWQDALRRAADTKSGRMTAAIIKRAVEALDEEWELTKRLDKLVIQVLGVRNALVEGDSEAPNQRQLESAAKAADAVKGLATEMVDFLAGKKDFDQGIAKLLEGEYSGDA